MRTTSLATLLIPGLCVLGSCSETTETSLPAGTLPAASQGPGPAAPATHVPPAQPAASAGPGPNLVFERTVVDFGQVWDVADMVGSFPFKNGGDEELVISDIKAACGCTTTELDAMTYAPGGSNAIDVVWDPKGFGPQSKTITVRSNSVGAPIQVLTIQAQIKPFAQFNGSAIQLGNLQIGEEHRQRMELTCVDPAFELLDLGASSKHVRVESLGPQANGSHGIEIIVQPNAPWGMLNSGVTARIRGVLKDTGETVEHEAEMRIQGSLVNKLTVDPMLFAVGHVLPGRSFERVVRLKHLDGAPFQVTHAEIMRPVPATMNVEIEPYQIGAEQGVMLRVKGQSGSYMGQISGQVRFETDIYGEGSHILPVLGMIRN